MRKIGYIRVSSDSQNPARQIEQLNNIGMDIIYEEKISGANTNRSELKKMLEELKLGDEIYVTDLTRITRSSQDLFKLISEIKEKKGNLKSLKDTWLDLSEDSPYSDFLITIMFEVNQLERDLIRMRQQEGIEIAKQMDKYKRRVKNIMKVIQEGIVKLYEERKFSVKEIYKVINISRSSLYRKLQDIGKNQQKKIKKAYKNCILCLFNEYKGKLWRESLLLPSLFL